MKHPRFAWAVFPGLVIAACAGGAAPRAEEAPPSQDEGGDEAPVPAPVDAGVVDAGAPDAGPPDLAELERVAYERARPVFDQHCTRCHVQGAPRATRGALRHFDMTSYPFGGHHADEVAASIREVLGATGEPPTMPRDDRGAVQGDELDAVLAWADAFERAHAAGLHPPRAHAH